MFLIWGLKSFQPRFVSNLFSTFNNSFGPLRWCKRPHRFSFLLSLLGNPDMRPSAILSNVCFVAVNAWRCYWFLLHYLCHSDVGLFFFYFMSCFTKIPTFTIFEIKFVYIILLLCLWNILLHVACLMESPFLLPIPMSNLRIFFLKFSVNFG